MATLSHRTRRRPLAWGLFALCGLGGLGIYVHGRRPSAQPPALLVQAQAATPTRSWQKQLDLDRARVLGGQFVQTLPDGTEVRYTLDPVLQEKARSILRTYELPMAAMVLYDYRSGEVLVLAGHQAEASALDTERLTLAPWAPAASIFKLVTAGALLDRGVSASTRVCYHGGLHGLTAEHLRDNPALDGACRTLHDAVAHSINPILAKLALRHLDRRSLEAAAGRFGFNRALPFELPVAPSAARIPADGPERAKAAAGFWHTELSPLHGAVLASAAASGGMMRLPHIVRSVRTPDQKPVRLPVPAPLRALKAESAADLRRMMVAATETGTARQGFHTRRGRPHFPGIPVAGKTGSLAKQNPFVHYSWFVGFAPADKPEVVFSVLLGNPMKWRIKASTAAQLLLAAYFRHRHGGQGTKSPGAPADVSSRRRPARKAP
ncbi:MAG: penicillin-binding protein [Deltaproteobacteria bacterium]|nr:penicillin-binding protein [Deltaproteobacteria bacterium]